MFYFSGAVQPVGGGVQFTDCPAKAFQERLAAPLWDEGRAAEC